MLFTNITIEYEDYRLNHKTSVWNSIPVNSHFFIAYLSMILFKNLLSSHVRLVYPIILFPCEISTACLFALLFVSFNLILTHLNLFLLTAQMLLEEVNLPIIHSETKVPVHVSKNVPALS